jgi:hypothetical protein
MDDHQIVGMSRSIGPTRIEGQVLRLERVLRTPFHPFAIEPLDPDPVTKIDENI